MGVTPAARRPCLAAVAVIVRQHIEIPVGLLTWQVEINKLNREYIAKDKILVIVVVKGYVACADVVKITLLASDSFRADKEFNYNVCADVFCKYLLYRAHHFLGVKGLLDWGAELGVLSDLLFKPVHIICVYVIHAV